MRCTVFRRHRDVIIFTATRLRGARNLFPSATPTQAWGTRKKFSNKFAVKQLHVKLRNPEPLYEQDTSSHDKNCAKLRVPH